MNNEGEIENYKEEIKKLKAKIKEYKEINAEMSQDNKQMYQILEAIEQETPINHILRGQRVQDKEYVGDTPLILATKDNNILAVKGILALGNVDFHIPDHQGKTALDHAQINGYFGIAHLILGEMYAQKAERQRNNRL